MRHKALLRLPLLNAGTPCDQTKKLLPLGKPRPELTILPNQGAVYVPYGTATAVYLGACPSGNRTTGCSAVAWDVQVSSGKRTDLTPFIQVSQSRECSSTDGVQVSRLQ